MTHTTMGPSPRHSRILVGGLAAATALLSLACGERKPDIFLKSGDQYTTKVDFARLEHEKPLTRGDLLKLTPALLESLSQEEVDQVYARLTAGPIPDGAYEGTFFFSKGGGLERITEQLGGLKGQAVGFKLQLLELVGQKIWKGKVFYRNERLLRNMIDKRPSVDVFLKSQQVDTGQLRQIKTGGIDAYLLFPARLYCGQSLLDGRRESIIIDYAFTDEIEGYQEGIDRLGGRSGTQIRDEIRMVRPGFYLGRAYLSRSFALNFTLLNKDVEGKARDAFVRDGRIEEDCRIGGQLQAALR
ncbi:MAG TPA: hypothetical protein VIZ31_00250 [Vicinamibacteria bacterium]